MNAVDITVVDDTATERSPLLDHTVEIIIQQPEMPPAQTQVLDLGNSKKSKKILKKSGNSEKSKIINDVMIIDPASKLERRKSSDVTTTDVTATDGEKQDAGDKTVVDGVTSTTVDGVDNSLVGQQDSTVVDGGDNSLVGQQDSTVVDDEDNPMVDGENSPVINGGEGSSVVDQKDSIGVDGGEDSTSVNANKDKDETNVNIEDSLSTVSSTEGDMCRICHCVAEDSETLISPCDCCGSMKWVHQKCLQKWVKSRDAKKCELCGFSFNMTSSVKPFRKWSKLNMSSVERRRVLCSVTFHVVAITCVIWSLYVLIDRTTQEIQARNLNWPFWTKLVVVAIGFTGGLVFMYVQCKTYVKLFRRWKQFNRIIYINDVEVGEDKICSNADGTETTEQQNVGSVVVIQTVANSPEYSINQ